MRDWNVIVTIRQHAFNRVIKLLRQYGVVNKTGMYNVLVMSVPDVPLFLEQVRERSAADRLFQSVSHLLPVTERFSFATPEEFERQARAIALEWAPRLAGKSFHVRMHRRGLKGALHRTEEEQALGSAVIDLLAQGGAQCRIDWFDPDAILSVETVRNEAGMALWTRADFERYPFLLASIEPRAIHSPVQRAGT
jgi:tRNA(Ser,Leu) C12 N-acetylase TAN1